MEHCAIRDLNPNAFSESDGLVTKLVSRQLPKGYTVSVIVDELVIAQEEEPEKYWTRTPSFVTLQSIRTEATVGYASCRHFPVA